MRKGYGTFLGVSQDWYRVYRVDETALRAVFARMRDEAHAAGCRNYPGRDDIASSDILFGEVVRRYEAATTSTVTAANYPEFRRWVLLLFKGGDMP